MKKRSSRRPRRDGRRSAAAPGPSPPSTPGPRPARTGSGCSPAGVSLGPPNTPTSGCSAASRRAGEQVGLDGHVVVEEQEQLAARLVDEDVAGRPGKARVDRADPGRRESAAHDGLATSRVAVRADEQLERRRVDLRLQGWPGRRRAWRMRRPVTMQIVTSGAASMPRAPMPRPSLPRLHRPVLGVSLARR